MNIQVIKRDCSVVDFDENKIYNAIIKAMKSTSAVRTEIARKITNEIIDYAKSLDDNIDIYKIEELIYTKLIDNKLELVAKAYEGYRAIREFQRECDNTIDEELDELLSGTSEYWNTENSNKNAKEVTVQRDYMAGVVSKDIARRFIFPPDIIQAHDEGIIHLHDLDYMGQKVLNNCCLVNLNDMLQNGTVINGKMIRKPHKFITACTIATQIITAVSSSQYGGVTITLTHLAPFVRDSYNRYLKKYLNRGEEEDKAIEHAKEDLAEEIEAGVQTFNYQVNTMSTTNGQAPFLSVCMYLGETEEYKDELAMIIEEFIKQRICGLENEVGIPVTQEFPKLLYVLEEDNIHKDSKYYYLTELSAKCSAKRLTPDYISEKIMKELEGGDAFPCMGCRSFLGQDVFTEKIGNISRARDYVNGQHKYYGRFNVGVTTLNLVDVALSSNGDMDTFWEILNERLDLMHRAMQIRFNRFKGLSSDVAPILWQNGAFARLDKHEPIDSLLYNGYATISLGYAGLYECVKYMTGESHSSGKGYEFGVKVLKYLDDTRKQWKADENIGYAMYGTPIENTTYKFAKCLKRRFGDDVFIKIDGHDRDYITNSFHINVRERIDPFEKLKVEAQYQQYSLGGCISYIESADMSDNIQALLKIIDFIYNNIMYAEINTKSDYCQVCGYDGEIKIIDENGKLDWECPNCGNRDHDKMNVARRTCGYIGSQFWSQGRTNEIQERYVHLDNHEVEL